MRQLATKQQILDEAGYRYSIDRELYFNRQAKRAFSVAFLADKSEEEIELLLHAKKNGTRWQFFFNEPPSESLKRQLESFLDK